MMRYLITIALLILSVTAIPIPMSQAFNIQVRPSISKNFHLFDAQSSFSIINGQLAFIFDPTSFNTQTAVSMYKEDSKTSDINFRYDVQKGVLNVNDETLSISLNSQTQAFEVVDSEQTFPSIFQINNDGILELRYNTFFGQKNYKLCPLDDYQSEFQKDTVAYGLYSYVADCENRDITIQLNLFDQECDIPLKNLQPDYLEVYDGSNSKIFFL